MRNTDTLRRSARVLLADPTAQHWGYDLSRRTDIPSGVLYPVLSRMLDAGWVTAGWEDDAPPGRPVRRYYELTSVGRTALIDMLDGW